jgi:hypothetical protein
MRKAILALFFVLFFTFTTTIPVLSQAPISVGESSVIYELPYPGILPDHPLYFVKQLRDNLLEFLTRDNLKKAELYLLTSDKHLVMSTQLANKDKHELAINTLRKGERYFQKIVPILQASKKQGVRPSDDLMRQIQNSSIKHRDTIEEFMSSFPQGNSETLSEILELNKDTYAQIEKIK